MAWYTCTINSAGPNAYGNEPPADPTAIYINLTDQEDSFAGYWFFAANNSKLPMLAVALTAISLKATVRVGAFPPNPGNNPATEISNLYINAP